MTSNGIRIFSQSFLCLNSYGAQVNVKGVFHVSRFMQIICLTFLFGLTISPIASAERGAFSIPSGGARDGIFSRAFVAIADDANASRRNPAGISSLLQTEFTFSHTNLFSLGGYFDYTETSRGVNQDFVGVAFPNSRLPIGVSLLNLDTNGIIAADDRGGILNRNAGYAERLLTLSAGKRIVSLKEYELALGLNLNRYWIPSHDQAGIGIDGGLLIRAPRFYPVSSAPKVGVMLHGLTREVNLDDDEEVEATIPPRVDIGIAYRFLRDQLTLAGAASKTSGDSIWRYAIGGEYQLHRLHPIHLSILSGYHFSGSPSDGGGGDVATNRWNVGLSLLVNRIKVDYAYLPHTDLGSTHRMTISILQDAPTEIYWQRGLAHDAMLEDDLALEAFQQLVNLNPRSTRGYYNMALIYERQRDLDKAIETLEHVRKIDADYFAENGLQQLIEDLHDQRK